MKTNGIKKTILLTTYAILLYFIVHHFSTFLHYVGEVLSVFTPLFIGLAIAFIVNLLLRFFERMVFDKIFKNPSDFLKKIKRPLCVILSYAAFVGIIWIIVNFISPKIADSMQTFTGKVPYYITLVSDYVYQLTIDFDVTNEIWNKFMDNFGFVINNTSQFINSVLPKIVDITKGITSSVIDIFIGCVFSVYMLLSKEKLLLTFKKVLHAHIEEKKASKIMDIIGQANKVFRSFVGGQLTEAVILGVLCYIGMSILNMPYAPLISVIIGVTSIIPVVGPFIGIIPSAFLILLESPITALWFIVFIIVLQQFEGNVIYPRVVGNAIGISGFWVLLAVTVGGGLFGIMGILLGVPLMAVVYSVYGQYVNEKIAKKQLAEQKE